MLTNRQTKPVQAILSRRMTKTGFKSVNDNGTAEL